MQLPPGVTVLERGWLSSNVVVLRGEEHAAIVDSGYCTHATQTLALVAQALGSRHPAKLVNTHLHSDHCGGNAALQRQYPGMQTLIPPGEAAAVRAWDEEALSYRPTGQQCPRFGFDGTLVPGTLVDLGAGEWEVHAAPGHDPDSVVLFEPRSRTLISADALWQRGFGVVFPELEGEHAFDDVAATLDLIERLHPGVVIPGHGPVFSDLGEALAAARRRLAAYRADPAYHATHAAKVLLKFKLLEWQEIGRDALLQWAMATPYLRGLQQRFFANGSFGDWIESLLADLVRSGAARAKEDTIHNA